MEDLYTYLYNHKDELSKIISKNERVNRLLRLTYDFYCDVLDIPKDKNKLGELIDKKDERIYKSFDCIYLNMKLSGYVSGLSVRGEDKLSSFLREVLDGIER